MKARLAIGLALLATVVGCGDSASTSPGPTGGQVLTEAQQKVAVLDRFGWSVVFCDPDSFPVGRDELVAMRERWPEVVNDPAFPLLVARHQVDPAGQTDDEALLLYRDWKMLQAVAWERFGDTLRFEARFSIPPVGATEARLIAGVVDATGRMQLIKDDLEPIPGCPICLVRGTRIAAPEGSLAVEDIRVGTAVWTSDRAGDRVVAIVLEVGRTRVGAGRVALRLDLADGRSVTASAGHPLVDGRSIGSLGVGDPVDGSTVVRVTPVANEDGWTFDLLPSGGTGTYWADEVALDSTIEP
jgi:hypothetical protein